MKHFFNPPAHVNPLWNIKNTTISAKMDFLRPHMSFFSNPMPTNLTFDGTPTCRVPSYNKMWPLTPIHRALGTKIGQK